MLSAQPVIWLAFAYIGAYAVTDAVIMPIQAHYGPTLAQGISILFLPHGVRVIATWLLGWRSVLAILPGNVVVFYVLFAGHPGLSAEAILFGIVFTSVVVPLSFEMLSRLNVQGLFASSGRPRFSSVLKGGILASVPNAAFFTVFLEADLKTFIGVVFGDTMGLVFMLLVLLCVFRFYLDKPDR